MSMSSPKLSRVQKESLKGMLDQMPEVFLFSFPENGVTVAIRRTGRNMGEFSVALAGEGEMKFRPKVGKFHAMYRMYGGNTMPVNLPAADLEVSEAEIVEIVANELAFAVGK
jgi:hypothetical protein